MSQENVQIVEMLIDEFRRGDHEGVFEYYDDAIEPYEPKPPAAGLQE